MNGVKHDQGKNELGLVLKDFARAFEQVGLVATFGAQKYARSNWLQVDEAERRYMDAMLRHLVEDLKGIELDEESGTFHLAHAAWCLMAVLELRMRSID